MAQVDYIPNSYYNNPECDTNSGKRMTIFLSEKVHTDFSNKVNKHNVTKKMYWLSLIQAYINNEFELTLDDKEIHTIDIEANRTRDKAIAFSVSEKERDIIREQAKKNDMTIVDYLVSLIRNSDWNRYVKEKSREPRKIRLSIKVTEEEKMLLEKIKYSEVPSGQYIVELVKEESK